MSQVHEFVCGCAVDWDARGVRSYHEGSACRLSLKALRLPEYAWRTRARSFLKVHGVALRRGKIMPL